MNEIKLIDITHNGGDLIHRWEYREVDDLCRIYYKPIDYDDVFDGGYGFYFYAVEVTSHNAGEKAFDKSTCVECIVQGSALFDGIRHLYYGDEVTDNYGYHYYPNIKKIRKVLKELILLEKEYCSEPNN